MQESTDCHFMRSLMLLNILSCSHLGVLVQQRGTIGLIKIWGFILWLVEGGCWVAEVEQWPFLSRHYRDSFESLLLSLPTAVPFSSHSYFGRSTPSIALLRWPPSVSEKWFWSFFMCGAYTHSAWGSFKDPSSFFHHSPSSVELSLTSRSLLPYSGC